ncbi:MAG: radical SAM protein [Desulfuromonas sp.]|jgi:nitrogen fixation protein NifB|nr:radical SAM protein [Desulfuromonas thiophila]MDY0399012.1 radical SAM protein [Desulfuromonas thiophila]
MSDACPKMKIRSEHPCFGGDHRSAARIHLPVAPGCNIKCGFCERRFDCVNESRPGVTSRILKPVEALERVRLLRAHPTIGDKLKVVGIAGPGDPLANDNTFVTLELVRAAYPAMTLCLSTNGLLLPEALPRLQALGLHSLTVTMNALTAAVGAQVYDWIFYRGKKLAGPAAAGYLIDRQLVGIEMAVQAGLLVKINHVYMPGINDHETLDLAVRGRKLGVAMMNILPLIPLGRFAGCQPPSEGEMALIRNQAELILSQARHCKQCRADAAGLIGQDLDLDLLAARRSA